jgi:hypothetical protein
MAITKLEWQFLVGNIEMYIDANNPAGRDIDRILDRLGAPYGFSVLNAGLITPEVGCGDGPDPEERLADFITRPKLLCTTPEHGHTALREAREAYRRERELAQAALAEGEGHDATARK